LFEVLETISKVYLVMEVAPVGEMYTHVSITGRYEESLAKNLYSQLISAVEFMVKYGLLQIRSQVVSLSFGQSCYVTWLFIYLFMASAA
jgi:hypothetical protein